MNKILQNKKLKITIIIIVALIALLLIAGGIVATIYKDKAKPGTSVEGIDVSGMNKKELINTVNSLYNDASLNILTEDGGEKTVTYPDLAISVDASNTADQVISSAKEYNIISRYLPFVKKENSINFIYENNTIQEKLNEMYKDNISEPQHARASYNKKNKTYEAVEGRHGSSIDMEKVVEEIDKATISRLLSNIELSFLDTNIPFDKTKADKVAKKLNDIKSINLMNNNSNVYTIKSSKLASFAILKLDTDTKEYSLDYDNGKIEAYLSKAVNDNIDAKPRQQIEFIEENGDSILLQYGKDGKQLKNVKKIASSIIDTAKSGDETNVPVEYKDATFTTKTVKASEENWIEVDISEQKTMLWSGDDLLITYIISSGQNATPTVKGTFEVWYKVRIQTMRGFNADGTKYKTPNVPWATYFHGDYAFHGCYWHNNFGRKMSHGCINMRIEDAKALYHFAPKGTKVVVHE